MVPLPLLLTLCAACVAGRTPLQKRMTSRAASLLAAVALGGIAGASLSPFRYFRYVVPVFPVVLGLASIGLASPVVVRALGQGADLGDRCRPDHAQRLRSSGRTLRCHARQDRAAW